MRVFNSIYFLLLALPVVFQIRQLLQGVNFEELIPTSGELSARLLLITLAITPLSKIFPKQKWTKWLIKKRRSLGVATFAYAVLHTVFYLLILNDLEELLTDFVIFSIWTGWLAFFCFIPLAITSNNLSVRLLKKSWKSLHRLVYLAALMVLLHWWFIHQNLIAAIVNFSPLIVLEVIRFIIYFNKKLKKENETKITNHLLIACLGS